MIEAPHAGQPPPTPADPAKGSTPKGAEHGHGSMRQQTTKTCLRVEESCPAIRNRSEILTAVWAPPQDTMKEKNSGNIRHLAHH